VGAAPPRRWFASLFAARALLLQLTWLLLCLPLLAQAQFNKTPWPATQASPALELTDLQGQRWSAENLKGRVVVLNFWATWCAPCKEEMPSLQTLHELGGGDPVVIGINVRETASHVKRYVKTTGIGFPVVLDPQAELAKRLGVSVFPTSLLLAPDGQMRWRVVGEVDWTGPEPARWIDGLGRSRRQIP
jgi:thiol-disulfide isomerase/thioredoxin